MGLLQNLSFVIFSGILVLWYSILISLDLFSVLYFDIYLPSGWLIRKKLIRGLIVFGCFSLYPQETIYKSMNMKPMLTIVYKPAYKSLDFKNL